MESFSIEFQDTIAHKSSKKGVFEILKETLLCLISIRAWVENLQYKKTALNFYGYNALSFI